MSRPAVPACGSPRLTGLLFLAARVVALPFVLYDLARSALRPPRPRVRPPTVRACDEGEPFDPRELCHGYGAKASARYLDWMASGDGPDPLDGEVAECLYGGAEGGCRYCAAHADGQAVRFAVEGGS